MDAYRFAQMCLPLRHPDRVYNLHKGTLKEEITMYFPKMREIKAQYIDYLRRYAACYLKGLCEQCPGKTCNS